VKTAISIPDDLFELADRLAERLGISRSQLYQQAIARFVASHDEAVTTERLDSVYAKRGTSALDPVLENLQGASIAREEW